jgi:hypothetical protein
MQAHITFTTAPMLFTKHLTMSPTKQLKVVLLMYYGYVRALPTSVFWMSLRQTSDMFPSCAANERCHGNASLSRSR